MNTPTHMIIGGALWAWRDKPGTLVAALAGGFAPDLSMLVMVLYATRIVGLSEHEVFGTLYFSDNWQRLFAIDHSFAVWSVLLLAALLMRRSMFIAFSGAGLTHAAVDFLTHHSDARQQFWPFTDWVFRSPVSYWDPLFWGNVVAPFEALVVVALTALILRRMSDWRQRFLTVLVALVYLAPIALTGGFHGLHGSG